MLSNPLILLYSHKYNILYTYNITFLIEKIIEYHTTPEFDYLKEIS